MEENTLTRFPTLLAVLNDYRAEVEALYKQHLVDNGHPTMQNTLVNSISTDIVVGDSGFTVTMTLAEYWKYVEWDTQPHWPPQEAILKWISIKPIIPRPDNRGRIPKPEQLAFLIRRAIAGQSPNQANLKNPQGGTIGTHDLAGAVTACNQKYEPLFGEALAKDLSADINVWIIEMLDLRH